MSLARSRALSVGIDTGGTFIDFSVRDDDSGQSWTHKVLAEGDRIEALLTGLRTVVAMAGGDAADTARIIHGTTIGTNLMLSSHRPLCGLLVTEGFEDYLAIGRHDAPRSGNIHRWLKDISPLPRECIIGIPERVAADGSVIRELDTDAVVRAAAVMRDQGFASIGVAFLHAPRFRHHELAAADAIAKAHPQLLVSLSHLVAPQHTEYERTLATAINAMLVPTMTEYIDSLTDALRSGGFHCPVYVMGSDGGMMAPAAAKTTPIRTLLSGPAAAVTGARVLARDAGLPKVFTLDVGGTSADIASVIDYMSGSTDQGTVGELPIGSLTVDIETVGAGGGSIADVGPQRLRVGPDSAGANPGPVAYGRGGSAATVTDALAVMGYLPPNLAGGSLPLDLPAATAALQSLADGAELDLLDLASGIFRVASLQMASTMRAVAIKHGYDSREFAIMAFGGAGAIHAQDVAQLLDIDTVIVPRNAGVFSTYGLLGAEVTSRCVLPQLPPIRLRPDTVDRIGDLVTAAAAEARRALLDDPHIVETVDDTVVAMRYQNQGDAIAVRFMTLPSADPAGFLREVTQAFTDSHRRRYGYVFPDVAIDITAVDVTARGAVAAPAEESPATRPATRPAVESAADRAPAGRITAGNMYFPDTGWAVTTITDQADIGGSSAIQGPAVIQDKHTTIVVQPGWSLRRRTPQFLEFRRPRTSGER